MANVSHEQAKKPAAPVGKQPAGGTTAKTGESCSTGKGAMKGSCGTSGGNKSGSCN